MKKLQLNFDFESEYTLLGICTPLKDYRLSWFLNQSLNLTLTKIEDFSITLPKNTEISTFSIYHYVDEESFSTYSFISNKTIGNVLVPEFHQADFLLLINGQTGKLNEKIFISEIKKIANVLTVFNIGINKTKSLEIIISDIEIHLSNIFRKEKQGYQPKANKSIS
ncbi:MAG: IPExxxVDY family protein [Bacteroidetes bacterium]|nr:IPExxxVDY family protein [Bacteroidota bacterium]